MSAYVDIARTVTERLGAADGMKSPSKLVLSPRRTDSGPASPPLVAAPTWRDNAGVAPARPITTTATGSSLSSSSSGVGSSSSSSNSNKNRSTPAGDASNRRLPIQPIYTGSSEEKAVSMTARTSLLVPETPSPAQGRTTAKIRWDEVMNKSKSSEQQRLESVKQQTYKGYRVDELGSGYVKDQIGEWEKLFMLRQATDEQVASTAAEGYRKLAQMNLQQASGDVLTIEDGSTSVFRLSDLVDTDRVSLIQRLIRQAGGRSAPLRSGLYALEDGKKPPIDIIAVAIMGEDGQCFVALTVNVIKGVAKELTSKVRAHVCSLDHHIKAGSHPSLSPACPGGHGQSGWSRVRR